MKADYSEQLLDYMEGRLSVLEQREVEQALASSESLRRELEQLQFLHGLLEELPEDQPSERLQTGFAGFLEEQKDRAPIKSRTRLNSWEMGVAAGFALLIIGAAFGLLWVNNQQQQAQINRLNSEMQIAQKLLALSMLENASASDRIQALNTIPAELGKPNKKLEVDPRVLQVLAQTLNQDENINVRIKAAEALFELSFDPTVIQIFLHALRNQDKPAIQILLIDMLVALNAKAAVQPLQDLLEDKDQLDLVKHRAAEGIEKLI